MEFAPNNALKPLKARGNRRVKDNIKTIRNGQYRHDQSRLSTGNEKCPYLPLLKNDFRKYFIAEKFMYASNGNITKFFSKWGAFSALCYD